MYFRKALSSIIIGRVGRPVGLFKSSTTVSNNLTVTKEKLAPSGPSIANVILNNPPVNSFNLSFTTELAQTLKRIEDSNEVEGIVIKSSLPSVFSAGLDLRELHGTSRNHLESFWNSIQNLWLQIYSSKLVTLSLIGGHCLAAGVLIAAACDHRIGITGQYSIGVTAAKIGLVAPPWFLATLCDLMGRRTTEYALQIGKTFSPDEAMRVGLLDQVCSAELAHDTCLQILAQYLTVSTESRRTMKKYLRAELIEGFEKSRDTDMCNMVDYMMKVSVQKNIGDYIQQLKVKK